MDWDNVEHESTENKLISPDFWWSFLEALARENSKNFYQKGQTTVFNLEIHLMLKVTMSSLL